MPCAGRFGVRCDARGASKRVRYEQSVPPRSPRVSLTGLGLRIFVGDLPLWARARQYRPARAGSPHSATMAAWEMTKEALRKVCRDNNG